MFLLDSALNASGRAAELRFGSGEATNRLWCLYTTLLELILSKIRKNYEFLADLLQVFVFAKGESAEMKNIFEALPTFSMD